MQRVAKIKIRRLGWREHRERCMKWFFLGMQLGGRVMGGRVGERDTRQGGEVQTESIPADQHLRITGCGRHRNFLWFDRSSDPCVGPAALQNSQTASTRTASTQTASNQTQSEGRGPAG